MRDSDECYEDHGDFSENETRRKRKKRKDEEGTEKKSRKKDKSNRSKSDRDDGQRKEKTKKTKKTKDEKRDTVEVEKTLVDETEDGRVYGPVDTHTVIKPRPSQGFPVLRECYCCSLLFANNHRCPAKDEKCSECNEYGHYSGLCLQWELQPLPKTPNNTAKYRENMRDNLIKSPLLNSPETFRRNMLDSIGKNKENQQEMTDKTTVNEDPDKDIQEFMPKKKRFRGMADNLKQMQNIIAVKNEPMENLKEKLAAAEAKNAKLENVEEKLAASEDKNAELEKGLDCEKKMVAQYQAKLKMYRNTSLNKSHNKLMDQLDTCKEEVAQLTEQRDKLFAYILKIQNHDDMVKQRVDDLVCEQKVIMTHLYKGYVSEKLQPWLRDCKYCGSKIAHHWEDCVAQDNTCKYCGVKNHFTAMCNKADLTMRGTSNAEKLVDSLKKQSKSIKKN